MTFYFSLNLGQMNRIKKCHILNILYCTDKAARAKRDSGGIVVYVHERIWLSL